MIATPSKTADVQEMNHLMRLHEAAMNRQSCVTLFVTGIAYLLCLFCCLTDIFLVGHKIGTLAFLPGAILLFIGAAIAKIYESDETPKYWVKYFILMCLYLAVLDLSLVLLIWYVPLIVGGAAFVYAYRNLRLTIIANILILLALPIAAVMNAFWGMPNPDMLPYPETISGIHDGYVTIWAMNHRDQWDSWSYFLRILRFHTLPMLFLMVMITTSGLAMTRRANERMIRALSLSRRIREIEACLLLMAGGNQSQEVILAVLGQDSLQTVERKTLSKEFVESIDPREIPELMRRFRRRCECDSRFAALAQSDPEAALKAL